MAQYVSVSTHSSTGDQPPSRDIGRIAAVAAAVLLGIALVVALWGMASGLVRAVMNEQDSDGVATIEDTSDDPVLGTGLVMDNRSARGAALVSEYRQLADAGAIPPAVSSLREALAESESLSCGSSATESVHLTVDSLRAVSYLGEAAAARSETDRAAASRVAVAAELDNTRRDLSAWVPADCTEDVQLGYSLPVQFSPGLLNELLPTLTDQWVRVWVNADTVEIENVARNGLWEAVMLEHHGLRQ